MSTKQQAKLESLLQNLNDINPLASFLEEQSLSNVQRWFDTGNYALNAIISGSLFKGIPEGRIVTFVGPESSGKTLIVNQIAAAAQKQGVYVVYFDSENALDADTARRLGCDITKIKHVPIETVEQCEQQVLFLLNQIQEQPELKGQLLIVIDSLGNLSTLIEKEKIEKGNFTPDMGLRAKHLKSMLRVISHAAAKTRCTVICTNHIYDDPNQFFTSTVKRQSGGYGPLYMSSVIVQLAKRYEKGESSQQKDATPEAHFLAKNINGVTLRALTVKNRFVPPFLEIEIYVNFQTGLSRFSGLLDLAQELQVITKNGHSYSYKDQTLGYYKHWKTNEKVWYTFLPELEQKLQQTLTFSNRQLFQKSEEEKETQ